MMMQYDDGDVEMPEILDMWALRRGRPLCIRLPVPVKVNLIDESCESRRGYRFRLCLVCC